MAVVNVKSDALTSIDSIPSVKVNASRKGGRVKADVGIAAFAASDATSIARMLRVRSDVRVIALRFGCADLGTSGTVDIGLHRTEADGGAVVDADLFASAVDTDAAALKLTDVMNESGVVAVGNYGKTLWEQLGLSADPMIDYDVTITRNSAQATGTVVLVAEYIAGNAG